jgi:hypothetical protein
MKKIIPQVDSQEYQVLKHLRRGWKISNVTAVLRYKICRLSAVIARLREKGWKIITEEVEKHDGKGKYGVYKLAK